MAEERTEPQRAFPCPTEGCLGNAWSVSDTLPVPLSKGGGVLRRRVCARCGKVVITREGIVPVLGTSLTLAELWLQYRKD